MTSILRCHCDEALLPSTIPAKRPHFFKIIHSTILRDGKLGIPKRFVRRYGKNLSNIMFLKVPSGAVWQVGLMRGDGEVWLQGGWQEFAEYYSIGYGHFLLFRYEGNSNFHVLIFDMTASEIEYPSTNATNATNAPHYEEPSSSIGGRLSPKMEEVDDDASVEILDVFPATQTTKEKDIINISSSEDEFGPCLPEIVEIESDVSVGTFGVFPASQNRKTKRNLPFLQPTKKRSHNLSRETDNTSNFRSLFPHIQSKGVGAAGVKFENSEIDAGLHSGMSGSKVGLDFYAKESCGRATAIPSCVLSRVLPPVTTSKEVGALQSARAFNPENPFFRAKMGPSYLGKHSLRIPNWFLRRHLKTENADVTLWGSEGRTWSTSYRTGRRDTELLYSGWKTFVQDNQLKFGDVCVFELIKSPGILLKVVIFRNNEGADH